MKQVYVWAIFFAVLLSVSTGCRKKDKTTDDPTTGKAEITKFEIPAYGIQGNINSSAKEITFEIPPGVNPTNLMPTITVNAGATPPTNANTAQDFSQDVKYTVTNGSISNTYIVKATAAAFSDGKNVPQGPSALLLFYGWPSLINGSSGSVSAAISEFKKFDPIVLGAGLELTSHSDHNNTIAIINGLSDKKVYGYIPVDVGTKEADFITSMDAWKAMGVKGIFIDQFDRVSRSAQNSYIQLVHNKGLSVFANGSATAVLGDNGTATALQEGDYYLLESFLVSHGSYTTLQEFKTNGDLAYKMMRSKKIRIAVAATLAVNSSSYTPSANSSSDFKYAWCGAAMYNFDAFQFTEANYSATTSSVYYYPNLSNSYGNTWIEKDWITQESASVYSRSTTLKKIKIDGSTHAGSVQ
ncbi:MAG: hypothetical protein JST70_01845 [Bacteroidetes bacterium]|nr:hypothetical protein [Bacteroidota bacterium]